MSAENYTEHRAPSTIQKRFNGAALRERGELHLSSPVGIRALLASTEPRCVSAENDEEIAEMKGVTLPLQRSRAA